MTRLSATALAAPGPVTILSSDPEDPTRLCGGQATMIKITPAHRHVDSAE
ncbi:hypothetical protein AB0D59_38180 [Streptomyces sp. NPDC048417]